MKKSLNDFLPIFMQRKKLKDATIAKKINVYRFIETVKITQ